MRDNHTEEISSCYETLECSEDATWPEIKRSYKALKELYSTSSLATEATGEEYLHDKSDEILDQINNAYRVLEKNFNATRLDKRKDIEEIAAQVVLFNGGELKKIREKLGVDLLDISIASNVQMSHFKNIEDGNYNELPTEIYLKGYLTSYAEYLSLDPQRVLVDYMQGMKEWRAKNGGEREKVSKGIKKMLPSWLGGQSK